MRAVPRWISKQAALALHEKLLVVHGGATGVRDEGLLEAALAAPRNRFAYHRSDILKLGASYAHALVRNHPFADGNKRVALTLAGVFLELNGFRLEASEQDAAHAVRALASREISELQFSKWLRMNSSKVRKHQRGVGKRAPNTRKARKKK